MAEMGQIAVHEDGSETMLTAKGWVPNTPELEAASALGGTGAFLANLLESVTLGGVEAPAELDQVSPSASTAGYLAPDLVGATGLLKGVVRSGAKQEAGTTMAERVKGSMFKTDQGFAKMPSDIVPGPLAGTARAVEAGIGAVPGMRVATDLIKIQRQKVLGSKLMRGLGFTDDEIKASKGMLTPDSFQQPLSRVDDIYDSARGVIDEVVQPGQVKSVVDDAAEAGLLTEKDIAKFSNKADSTGDQLLELRSDLRAQQRSADSIIQKKRINEIIDNIQEIISDATEGTPIKAELDQADKIYKLWKTVDNGAAIAADGSINVRTMQNALNRAYGSRAVKGGRGVADPLVDDLIKSVDELGQLGPALPSSGTAERALAAQTVLGAAGITAATR